MTNMLINSIWLVNIDVATYIHISFLSFGVDSYYCNVFTSSSYTTIILSLLALWLIYI